MTVESLKPHQLINACDPALFEFVTTDELSELDEIIGQPRAVEALRFGIGIQETGYNIFALGPEGIGKRTIVNRFFKEKAESGQTPSDWCYVHNFDQSSRPNAIQLPPGKGVVFCKDMDRLVDELGAVISAAFESDEYRTRKQVIEAEFKERQDFVFESVKNQAREQQLMVLRTPAGLMFAPQKSGQVLPPEEFQKLPEKDRQKIEEDIETLQEALQEALEDVPDWQRELRNRLREVNREKLNFSVGKLIDGLREFYAEFETIVAYLDDVQNDVVENSQDFKEDEESSSPDGGMALIGRAQRGPSEPFRRYKVNLMVDHSQNGQAPVIYEDNPNYQNLIGRVEQVARLGALVTDFTLIKSGSLLQANGGYIIIEARKLLTEPYAWEGLKRALLSEEVKIATPSQMMNLITTTSLEPEPIPLNVKVALLGDRMLYYTLAQYDPDFAELFKVAADFDDQMERDDESLLDYARVIGTLASQNDLMPLNREAVAKVIEHSSRLVSDSEKLSASLVPLIDIMREAHYWAKTNGDEIIQASHIEKAIEAQIYRSNRLQERMQEQILRETILIETQGESVGQINGLSVLQLGNLTFGKPSRISAQIRAGKGEVIDVEREVELGGPLHSKGVLILSSFIGARYAANQPLSLNASLVFEQSYGGVDGDSASSAELYALLSAITKVPLKQSLAVTGSVNQHGEVQAIGGVNEKIEGFFDLCQARGLTGEQGVLIPASNVKHLMLRRDIVDAVQAGEFQIYPVETIDEGVEILTGIPPGTADENGKFPAGSINQLAQDKLNEMTRLIKSAGESAEIN